MQNKEDLHLNLHSTSGGNSGRNQVSGNVEDAELGSIACIASLIAEGTPRETYTSVESQQILLALRAKLMEDLTLMTLLKRMASSPSMGSLVLTFRFDKEKET